MSILRSLKNAGLWSLPGMVLLIMSSITMASAFGTVNAELARGALTHLYVATYCATHLTNSSTEKDIDNAVGRGLKIAERALR